MLSRLKSFFYENKTFFLSALLFFLLLPLSLKINFYQNDDWAFYQSVESFLEGNFSNTPIKIMGKSAPLFYTQGFLGFIFSAYFKVENLPILTLLVSVGCFYLLAKILIDFYKKSFWESVLISLIFFFNPIFVYSTLGFMTENYFLCFVLLSIYFFEKYKKENSWKKLLAFEVGVTLSFFVRQIALILSVGMFVEILKKREWKKLIVHSLISFGLLVFYYLYYYSGSEYTYSGLNFMKFKQWDYFRSVFLSFFIYTSAFLLPFLIFKFTAFLKNLSFYQKVLVVVLYFLLIILFKRNFISDALFKGEFPYLGNTFMRKGFYADGVHGTKYHFIGIHDMYKYWDLASFYISPILLILLLVKLKDFIGFYGVSSLVYIAFMLFLSVVYDRYLTFLLLVMLLQLVSKTKIDRVWKKIFVGAFLIFQIIISYQFSMDFVISRNYIWRKSEELVEEGAGPSRILSSHAFRRINSGYGNDFDYLFTYDSPDILSETSCCKNLVETFDVEYPYSFFVNPRVYLYEK